MPKYKQNTKSNRTEDDLFLFKNLIEHSSDAIGISTPEGKHYYQNEAFNLLFGDVGNDASETVYVDKELGKHVFKTIIGGGTWQGEVKMFKKDGTILDVFLRADAIRNKDGCIIGLVGIHTDITERKRAKAELSESEQHIRTISNNIINGMIYQAIRINNHERKITYLSDTVREFYGITPQEGIANANLIYDRFHEEDRERIHMAEELAHGTMSTFKTEARVINHKGEMRWSLFVSSPKKLSDGTTCWDGIEFDITERKLAEEERERLIIELQEALAKVKTLSGLLPICAVCKKIRADTGYWEKIEEYISRNSDAEFTHGICPACAKKIYPDFFA